MIAIGGQCDRTAPVLLNANPLRAARTMGSPTEENKVEPFLTVYTFIDVA